MRESLVIDTCSDSRLRWDFGNVVDESHRLELKLKTVDFEPNHRSRLDSALTRLRPELIFCLLGNDWIDRGRECIRCLRSSSRRQPLIAVADRLSSDQVIGLFQDGITDFVVTPIRESSLVPRVWWWRSLDAARQEGEANRETKEHARLQRLLESHGIVGSSRMFLQEAAKMETFAETDAPVLVCGETGTGKELIARAIHKLSRRSPKPFVAINCGAIPVELIENELFGHERGAYTGSTGARTGLIAAAEGGTLFLDEINSLPALAQVKLLRFLQEGEYRRLGSTKLCRADVRVVAASNRDLKREVDEGRMRSDLYFRLNVLPLTIPPLRERMEDVPLLVKHFCQEFAQKNERPLIELSPQAIKCLMVNDWRGNARELAYVVERSLLLGEGSVLGIGESESPTPPPCAGQTFKDAKAECVASFERRYIEQGLRAFQGNISHAARAAGKNRRAYWELIRKHHINVRQFT